jgi:hypothetical protein
MSPDPSLADCISTDYGMTLMEIGGARLLLAWRAQEPFPQQAGNSGDFRPLYAVEGSFPALCSNAPSSRTKAALKRLSVG